MQVEKLDRTTVHAQAVCEGETGSGETEKQACRRHLNDLERQNTDDFPYYFDVERADELLDFDETLYLAEGGEHPPSPSTDFRRLSSAVGTVGAKQTEPDGFDRSTCRLPDKTAKAL